MTAKRGNFQSRGNVPKSERLIAGSGYQESRIRREPSHVENGVVVSVKLFDASDAFGRRFGRVQDADFAIFVGDGEMSLRSAKRETDDERRNGHAGFVACELLETTVV